MHARRLMALAVLAAAVTASVSLAACGRDLPPSALVGASSIPVAEREPMPHVSGPTLSGSTLDLSALRGKVVVLNSWASWCGPCTQEAPQIAEFRNTADPSKVAVVGLDVSDKPGDAKDFVVKYGITYPSIVDPEGALLATVPGVPPAALPST
ncbi:MAG: TlpA disulfide reductase family protein, partial [Candidatus Nanopelagicales bacterium]|nr:TlpA disulfide reductase family protein [Candidatus Nanopelagicales bacterium]